MDLILKNNNATMSLLNNKDKFILKSAEALHGVTLSYAENESPYIDGSNVDNVRVMPRGILLTFILQGEIEASRKYFKDFIKSKTKMTLQEITDDHEIQIKGIARIPNYTNMERLSTIQLELYCGQPYWEDINVIVAEISDALDLLYFPMGGVPFGKIDVNTGEVIGRPFGEINTDKAKTIVNHGDTSVGLVIDIVALSTITNPKISCSTGEQNGWYMKLNLTMSANDIITISTIKGEKKITYNGLETYDGNPILSYLEFVGGDWLQLELGENTYNVMSDDLVFNAYFDLNYKRKFE